MLTDTGDTPNGGDALPSTEATDRGSKISVCASALAAVSHISKMAKRFNIGSPQRYRRQT
jgi:hypothetical protein